MIADSVSVPDPFEVAARLFEPTSPRNYLYRPADWAQRFIRWQPGQGLVDYQTDALNDLVKYRKIAIRGPHGLGKSAIAAQALHWFASTREAAGIDWKVITTASAWRHLTRYLWPEIHKWYRVLDWGSIGRSPYDTRSELLTLHLTLRYGAASAVASANAEFIEGAHADSLLYIIDEAKIVPPDTWEAIEGAFSGAQPTGLPEAFALALSTPGPPAGTFYEIHRRKPGTEDWHAIHVTLQQAIKAGRVSREWANQRRKHWGADSAAYVTRVLGNFHSDDDEAIIPLAWVEAANERWLAWQDRGADPAEYTGRRILGVDVARTGTDSSVLAPRIGPLIERLIVPSTSDTMVLAAEVQVNCGTDPARVPIVDSAGVGGGVVDRLREIGHPVTPYTGAASTDLLDRTGEFGFSNVRSAAYWRLRELLDPAFDSKVALPPSDELTGDLTTPHWKLVSGSPPKIKLETKEDLIKRLGRSPDHGDAVAMSFWADAIHSPVQIARPDNRRQMPVSRASPLARNAGPRRPRAGGR